MASFQSDSESNVSGFVRYSNKNFKQLYSSVIENFGTMNQTLLEIEQNMKNLVKEAGPLEGQLNALLNSLPKPYLGTDMDTN